MPGNDSNAWFFEGVYAATDVARLHPNHPMRALKSQA